jgi:hypothetical protein
MKDARITFAARDATPADHPPVARLFPELGVSAPTPTAGQFAARMLPRVVDPLFL